MGVYYLSLILCDFSLSSDTTDHAFLLFTVFSNTIFSASPEAPRLVRLCFPGSPSSSSSGCCSSVLRLWPPLLHCTPWLSSPFHYPGVSHHLKVGNSSIFFELSFGSLSYAPDSYTPLLQVQQTQHAQKELSMLCAQGTPSILMNSIELCSCVCKFS